MGGLPAARIDAHRCRAAAVEAAIGVTRADGRVEARGERSPWRAREAVAAPARG